MSEPQRIGPVHRILVIDDNVQIHCDIAKILGCTPPGGVTEAAPLVKDRATELSRMKAALFGKTASAPTSPADAPCAEPDAEAAACYSLDFATQGEDGVAMVREAMASGKPYAMAFVDMRMPPGWDGLRTIRELWAVDSGVNIVICTAFSDTAWSEVDTLAAGTDRLLVLTKPFEPIEVRRLAATMTTKWAANLESQYRMGQLRDLVAQRTAQLEAARQRDQLKMDELEQIVHTRTAELRRAATHDDLTRLPNRALFHDRLVQALAASNKSSDGRIAVMFIDFDGFKAINDTLGHDTGDLLLRAIAERILSALQLPQTIKTTGGQNTTAARLGGDEFCVLLPNLSNENDAIAVADRVLRTLQAPYTLCGREVRSTASIGIAFNTGSAEDRAEDLVRDADHAMYRAKREGKNRCVVYDREVHQAAWRLSVETDVRGAIDRNELRIFYQPIISLVTGDIISTEALVRWQHPERGIVGPSEFLPAAVKTGCINEVGGWVIENACRQLADWRMRIPEAAEMGMSINLSPEQLSDARLVDRVESILRRMNLPAAALSFEITEPAILHGAARAVTPVLDALKALGVKLVLDDFGTGYASLRCIEESKIDCLKIGNSFVREANGNRRFAAIIHSIVGLSRNLGIDVIAEGVESLDQVAMLQALDCLRAQGFLFCRPSPSETVEQLLRCRAWAVAA